MARLHGHTSSTRSWILTVLAVLSVLAPVWADVYQCPMARAERQPVASCCARVAESGAMHRHGQGFGSRFEAPCHCPQLQWEAAPLDDVRPLRSDFVVLPALVPVPTFESVVPAHLGQFFASVIPEPRPSGPPLWVLHQSIRC